MSADGADSVVVVVSNRASALGRPRPSPGVRIPAHAIDRFLCIFFSDGAFDSGTAAAGSGCTPFAGATSVAASEEGGGSGGGGGGTSGVGRSSIRTAFDGVVPAVLRR